MNQPESIPNGQPWGPDATPYEALGGDAEVRRLTELFYDRIDASAPTLRAMLPKNDSVTRDKLYEFLSGWLGGPALYVEKRGHPMLRMRHMPFSIGPAEAQEWLRCMADSLDEMEVTGPLRAYLDAQFRRSAQWMENR
ncbi:group II truncated hemoglobin [Actinomycetota bacterium]